MTTVLDDAVFPIVGWAGPSGDMIRPDVMAGMAEAGFTVSHSSLRGDVDEVLRALDVAAESGLRLQLQHPIWHVGDTEVFDDDRLHDVAEMAQVVRVANAVRRGRLRVNEGAFYVLAK